MSPQSLAMPPDRPEIEQDDEALSEGPIVVQVDDEFAARVNAEDLTRTVALALAEEGRAGAEVTLVITGDAAVRQLNAQYRGLDEPTDVLSFSGQEDAPGFVSGPDAAAYLGDIIIALPFTERQAAALSRPLGAELRLLAVHGVLHLLGYDHFELDDEARMWARQDAILAQL